MILKKAFRWLFNVEESQGDITILYGTFSGNSKLVAKELEKQLLRVGVNCICRNVGDYDVSKLEKERYLLLVISTYGEGDPTPDCWTFFDFLEESFDLSLAHLKYSICALGDSSYEHYCKVGDDVNHYLKEASAKEIVPTQKCDVDFVDDAKVWIQNVVSVLSHGKGSSGFNLEQTHPELQFDAVVKRRTKLTSNEVENEVFHVELAIDNEAFKYQPGDCLVIKPINEAGLVTQIANLVHQEDDVSFKTYLGREAELTHLSKDVIRKYNKVAQSENLSEILFSENQLVEFMKGLDFSDLLIKYPADLSIEQLKEILPTLQPRYYSVASCQHATKGEVHLTVKTVRYSTHNKQKKGACSGYLNHILSEGNHLSVKLKQNEFFRFPPDNRPVVMIANGVGIAPFISFLSCQNIEQKSIGMHLYYGIRSKESDYLYENELDNYLKHGTLSSLTVATSREGKKQYVQNVLAENVKSLVELIENDGANVYVCGAVRMGKDVRQVLKDGYVAYGMTPKQALDRFHELLHGHRYNEDLF